MRKLLCILLLTSGMYSCSELNTVIENIPSIETDGSEPSSIEINRGLKAALEKGVLQGVSELAKSGGYLNEELYKIYFPKSAQKVEKTLRDIGFDKELERLVVSLNKAAENAVTEAKPIFVDAIKNMTFEDARKILFGSDTAATSYLKSKTATELQLRFEPHISESLDQVNATKYWTEIMTQYNKIPFVDKVETDLSSYVTKRAINGLFLKIAKEEKLIRENPQARTTELLRKVFSYAGNKEN